MAYNCGGKCEVHVMMMTDPNFLFPQKHHTTEVAKVRFME